LIDKKGIFIENIFCCRFLPFILLSVLNTIASTQKFI